MPSYSIEQDGTMTIEEYAFYLESGFMEDEEEEEIIPEFQIKEKESEKYNSEDEIKPDSFPVKLKAGKSNVIESYKKVYEEEKTKNEFFKRGKLTVFSDNKGELSDYMTKELKTSINANYKLNKLIDINAGHETRYVNPDATLGARKFYFNPRLNLSKNLYFDYTGKFSETNKNVEQEVGLNFKPKFLHDSASFGIKAGSTINSEGENQSRKVKFTSDFYIFWELKKSTGPLYFESSNAINGAKKGNKIIQNIA